MKYNHWDFVYTACFIRNRGSIVMYIQSSLSKESSGLCVLFTAMSKLVIGLIEPGSERITDKVTLENSEE